LLMEERATVVEASVLAEYANPEAFTRAFRVAYGCSPSEYRHKPGREWKLPAPSNVHWLPSGSLKEYRPIDCAELDVRIVERPKIRVAAIRHFGDYLTSQSGWRELERVVPTRPWQRPGIRLFGVYHDDPYRYRDLSKLRSDIGYELESDEHAPHGTRCLTIPGGVYVVTAQKLGHPEYIDVWQNFNKQWLPRRGSRPVNVPAIDEFDAWPLPWEKRELRVMIGVGMELGFI